MTKGLKPHTVAGLKLLVTFSLFVVIQFEFLPKDRGYTTGPE